MAADDPCAAALERLQRYLDGELEEDVVIEIAQHLEDCFPCGDRARFELHVRHVVRVHATEVAPEGLVERVRARCFGDEV